MQKQIISKPLRFTNAAFISAVAIVFYEIFISFVGVFMIVTNGLHCNRQDFGACALQNLFVDLFAFIAALLFGLILPVFLILANGILISTGWRRNDGRKSLLIASLALEVLAVVMLSLLWAFAVLFPRS